jgi:hypothetical protein
VKWNFDAVRKGAFGTVEPTHKTVHVPGCSIYEYQLATRQIPAGRIYFDFATLLWQIAA